MLLVAWLNDTPPPALGTEMLVIPGSKVVDIDALTDRTFELRLADGRHNVDAVVAPRRLLEQFSVLAGHERAFDSSRPDLAAALAALRPRARTPNIDFEWPEREHARDPRPEP